MGDTLDAHAAAVLGVDEDHARPGGAAAGGVVEETESGVVQALGGSLLAGPLAIDLPEQSAPLQYTAPGTLKFVGRETCSTVLAR